MQACADSLSAWSAAIVKGQQGLRTFIAQAPCAHTTRLRHGPASAVASAPCSPILLFRRDKMGMCRFIGHRMAANARKDRVFALIRGPFWYESLAQDRDA
ncbi:hypothetical protein C3386_25385 [Enterobacter cloacae complex sp. ECNIH12]|nr:hypothetical protein C3386_25385 [Enterobacter cloacae complex sp. ECNIH12]